MDGELWGRLASLFYAAGLGLIASLASGLVLVPWLQRRQFVSRETKQGVRQGKRDEVPMGGGFILLVGLTVAVLLLTGLEQIRRGYTACFLLGFWGFALLGYLDDRSKARAAGYSEKLKIALQVLVTLGFALSFYWYAKRIAKMPDVGLLHLPFVGYAPLGWLYVPFASLFMFYVSNAVNMTDGFDGLAGGVGAVIAAAYAVVCFLIGASALHVLGDTAAANPEASEVMRRMFALSLIASALAGSLIAYLYFNYARGMVYFGDTGSMALGAAIAFLALFSRTEFLLIIVGGVLFVEATSSALQRGWVALQRRCLEPGAAAVGEPWLPLVMAPLHHHFEHLLCREREARGEDRADLERVVRRQLTRAAWLLATTFAVLGVAAQYAHYRRAAGWYEFCCLAGLLLIALVLLTGVATRLRYDCYFFAPDRLDGSTLTLYRGLPLRRWHELYEPTTIRLGELRRFEARAALYRPLGSRVDARLALGSAHLDAAERDDRATHLAAAARVLEQVPLSRFLVASRLGAAEELADAYRELGRPSDAVRVLEFLARTTGRAELAEQAAAIGQAVLEAAEASYAAWRDAPDRDARETALAAHEQLRLLVIQRRDRALQLHLAGADGAEPSESLQVLEQAVAAAEERRRRLTEGSSE